MTDKEQVLLKYPDATCHVFQINNWGKRYIIGSTSKPFTDCEEDDALLTEDSYDTEEIAWREALAIINGITMDYTIEQLNKETCQSFGGNNCVLHQCMFQCALQEAKKKAEDKKQNNYTKTK